MSYSDIISDGGMDPRNRLDEAMYRHTVAQRDAAWREVESWKRRYDKVLDQLVKATFVQTTPRMLADAESFEAGKAMAFNSAQYSIGIDTAEGVHTVVVYRNVPGQPTTLVASARLPVGVEDDWK